MEDSVGVIVGRFQVPELHDGHRFLIQFVQERHRWMLIILGSPTTLPTANNPLSYQTRRDMILEEYPQAHVLEIKDSKSDAYWDNKLDYLIRNYIPAAVPDECVTLYGSRDSFLKTYNGKYKTHEVPSYTDYHGKSVREALKTPIKNIGFRQGVIHSIVTRPQIVYPTVDITVWKKTANNNVEVLLGQKKSEDMYRFIGGFVDPTDESLEAAALRELGEEAKGIEVHSDEMEYIGSYKIKDWRYSGTPDGIMSTFFAAPYFFGTPIAGDDLAGLTWINVSEYMSITTDKFVDFLDMLVLEHRDMGTALLKKLSKKIKMLEN